MGDIDSFIEQYKKEIGCKNVIIIGSKVAISKLQLEENQEWLKIVENNYIEESDKVYIINGDE